MWKYINLTCPLLTSCFLFIHLLILSFKVQARDGGCPTEEEFGRRGQEPWATDGWHETKTQSDIRWAQWTAGTGQKGNELGGQKRKMLKLNFYQNNTSNMWTLLQNKVSVEKNKQALESELNELQIELKTLTQSKCESEHRRKKAEALTQEMQVKFGESECQKQDLCDKITKLQVQYRQCSLWGDWKGGELSKCLDKE